MVSVDDQEKIERKEEIVLSASNTRRQQQLAFLLFISANLFVISRLMLTTFFNFWTLTPILLAAAAIFYAYVKLKRVAVVVLAGDMLIIKTFLNAPVQIPVAEILETKISEGTYTSYLSIFYKKGKKGKGQVWIASNSVSDIDYKDDLISWAIRKYV